MAGRAQANEWEAAEEPAFYIYAHDSLLGTHLETGKHLGRNCIPSETQGSSNSLSSIEEDMKQHRGPKI